MHHALGAIDSQAAFDVGPVFPDYQRDCLTTVMPALAFGTAAGTPLPDEIVGARQIVLLTIDGLGHHQLIARGHHAPTLFGMDGAVITSVIPSTTSAALTSLTTGAAPGEHGIVGYRIAVDGETLNALRWTTQTGDARERIPPSTFQSLDPFVGTRPIVVTRGEFRGSGFSQAHLDGGDFRGYRTLATLVYEVQEALAEGKPLIYAYYDGLDLIGHEYGHGGRYDAELRWVDRLVADIAEVLAPGAALVVTADHGQVVTEPAKPLASEVVDTVAFQSGEARMRWLHCRPGAARACFDAAQSAHHDEAWVASLDQVIDEGWFGPQVTADARARMGDVIVAARGTVAFADPADGVPNLLGRHGSLTPAEMHVPLRWLLG